MPKIHNSTQDKILTLLLNNKTKEFSIRGISNKISIDYKTVHIKIKSLAESGIIKTRKAGQATLCSIKAETFHPAIFRAEFIRRQEILKNKGLYVLYTRLKEDIKKPFFILLLFGSYASKTNKRGSDIDLMLICDDKQIVEKAEKLLRSLPLKTHFVKFNTNEFDSMLKTTEFNVGKEAFKNNVILFGIEDYCRLLEKI